MQNGYRELNESYNDSSVFQPGLGSPFTPDLSTYYGKLVQVSDDSTKGPLIETLGVGESPLEKEAVPADQLDPSVKMLIEALPEIPPWKVCAPLTKEEHDKYKPGSTLSICKAKTEAEMSDWEKAEWKERNRVHLEDDDKVVLTPDGDYLVLHPIEFRS